MVVNQAKEVGLDAIRAYASNGLAIGEAEDVDVRIEGFRGQCKMRKKIASHLKPPESCEIALVKEDREDTLVVMRYPQWLDLIKKLKSIGRGYISNDNEDKKKTTNSE